MKKQKPESPEKQKWNANAMQCKWGGMGWDALQGMGRSQSGVPQGSGAVRARQPL